MAVAATAVAAAAAAVVAVVAAMAGTARLAVAVMATASAGAGRAAGPWRSKAWNAHALALARWQALWFVDLLETAWVVPGLPAAAVLMTRAVSAKA